jgi:hypothetical protein
LPYFDRFSSDIELFADGQIKIEGDKLDATTLVVSLTVREASLNDTGEFKVIAMNVAGTATCSSRLVVNSKLCPFWCRQISWTTFNDARIVDSVSVCHRRVKLIHQ